MGNIRQLLFYLASYLCIFLRLANGSTTFQDGSTTYTVHYNKIPYEWDRANQLCWDERSVIAQRPFSDQVLEKLILDYDLESDVWISNEDGECLSLRETCKRSRSLPFGGERCQEYGLGIMNTDCLSKKRYIVCSREISTTTSSTTTSTTTTRRPTTTKAPARITFPVPFTTRGNYPQPPAKTSQPTYPASGKEEENNHLTKFGHALVGISMGQTDLLGLAIGVVTGSCLIVVLLLVLCCACQGKKPIYNSKYDFENPNRNSQHSLLKSGQSSSNNSSLDHPTRLTEESSLELSVAPSHTSKLCVEVPPKTYSYPPPPGFYNGTLEQDNPCHYGEIDDQPHPGLQNFNRAPSRSPKSVTYASIHKNRDSVLSEDLPPPPPLPPQRGYDTDDDTDEDETCIKGLNPTFKTFLDKTIAGKPQPPVSLTSPTTGRKYQQVHHSNFPLLSVDRNQLPPPPPPTDSDVERAGLITSDL